MAMGITRSEQTALVLLVAVLGGVAWRAGGLSGAGPASREETSAEVSARPAFVERGAIGSRFAAAGAAAPGSRAPQTPAASSPAPARAPGVATSEPAAADSRIDLNAADERALDTLPGIGPARAADILAHREAVGGFESVEQLDDIAGIGPATVEKLRPYVRVGPRPSGGAPPVRATEAPAPIPERSPPPVAAPIATAVPITPAPPGSATPRRIDINKASIEDLQEIPGVGPKIAERIVRFRETRPFLRPEDLIEVSGIGPKTFEKMRPYVATNVP